MSPTPAQYAALKVSAMADQDAAGYIASGDDYALADWLNTTSTTTVFKSLLPLSEVGQNFDAAGLSAMTSGNNDRLTSFALWNGKGVYPSRADHRQFFEDVFSPASGATTRTRLYTLWRRIATRAESILATGTGTDADPATLTYEGKLSPTEASIVRVS